MIDRELDVDEIGDSLSSGEAARQLLALDALLECDRRGPLPEPLLALVLDALGHERKAVQRNAAQVLALWSRTTPEVSEHLRALLGRGPLRHRFGAAFALAKLGPDPATLPVLLETLGEADGDMRWAAAALVVELARRNPELRDALVKLAARGTAAQRKMAFYCLRDLGGASAELEEILGENLAQADPGVRLAALAALGRLFAEKDSALRAVLRVARADADDGVRRAAVSQLGGFPGVAG
ncbi:MAG: HEAT repeat domain-containing protein, partial [Candidatus Binatia bacterium]